MKWFYRMSTWLLYGYVFLLPGQARWIWREASLGGWVWEYGRGSLYLTDFLWVALLLCAWCFPHTSVRMRQWWLALGALVIIAFGSVLASVHADTSWYAWLRLLQGISLIWIIYRLRFSWRGISIALIGAGVVQAGFGIWQFFFQEVMASTWLGMASHAPAILGDSVIETTAGRFLRAYGTLPHPNILGGFLAVCLVLLIPLLASVYRDWKYGWYGAIGVPASFVIILTGLLFTFSRSAWLGAGVAFVGMFVASLWQRDRLRMRLLCRAAVWGIAVIAVCWILIPEPFQTHLIDGGRLEQRSSDERMMGIRDSFEQLGQTWVAGTGIGASTYANFQERPTTQDGFAEPVHDIYLLVFVELGILGGMLFLWLLGLFITSFMHQLTRRPPVSDGYIAFAVAVACVLVIGLFEHFIWSLAFGGLLFWLLFGMWLKIETFGVVDK
ncbi:MAG: O-antigen ligase family protein [Candidatus Kerfeldbacteria bacterium]|nr:O-antigen ligase family protein [Candidatus Kerfeldbacteria bacterium]